MMNWIKKQWHSISDDLSGTQLYFCKSPSSILQRTHIVAAIKQYASGTTLDVGAGRSVYKPFFPANTIYHPMDFAETESTYKKTDALHITGDVQSMSMITDNIYDTVLCSEVLEHVAHPEKAAAEILRVLKPGGYAIITTPFLGYYHDEPYDFYRYTKHGLRTLFETKNSTIISVEGVGGLFSFIGYIRSTIVLSIFYGIPIIWHIIFAMNYILALFDIFIDRIFKFHKIMPITNIMIVQKK